MKGFVAAFFCFISISAFSAAPPVSSAKNTAIGASLASLLIWNPMQLDGIGVDVSTDEKFNRTRLLWFWDFKEPIKDFGYVTLNGHTELAFGQILPSDPNVIIGLTPVLEWQLSQLPFQPTIETGLGLNYLSRTEHEDHQFSTHFQFGETIGLSVQFKKLQLGVRYQHLSNADVVRPNNGYNFYGVILKYHY